MDVLNHPEALVEMTLGSQVNSHVRRALAQKLRSQLALVKGGLLCSLHLDALLWGPEF